jgi:hypothetical protein
MARTKQTARKSTVTFLERSNSNSGSDAKSEKKKKERSRSRRRRRSAAVRSLSPSRHSRPTRKRRAHPKQRKPPPSPPPTPLEVIDITEHQEVMAEKVLDITAIPDEGSPAAEKVDRETWTWERPKKTQICLLLGGPVEFNLVRVKRQVHILV